MRYLAWIVGCPNMNILMQSLILLLNQAMRGSLVSFQTCNPSYMLQHKASLMCSVRNSCSSHEPCLCWLNHKNLVVPVIFLDLLNFSYICMPQDPVSCVMVLPIPNKYCSTWRSQHFAWFISFTRGNRKIKNRNQKGNYTEGLPLKRIRIFLLHFLCCCTQTCISIWLKLLDKLFQSNKFCIWPS